MKKISFGSWIVLSLVVFAVAILSMVFISMNQRVDLVTEDYYERELQYQQQINVVERTNALGGKVSFDFTSAGLTLHFPIIDAPEKYSGVIMFFRPSDKMQDVSYRIAVDSTYTQSISTANLSKGLWRVKISWSVGEQNFYTERPVIIQ